MTRATYGVDETIRAYLLANSPPEHPLLAELREITATMTRSRMQISPEQGHFLAFLVRLIGARRVLEVGTYTGYSSLCMALAMPSDGRIVACDKSAEWTDVAQQFWKKAGLADRIELRLGSAVDTLEALVKERQQFDFVFIDANKEDYDAYYESSLRLVRPNGLIAIDNMLREGRVADPSITQLSISAVRDLNAKIAKDERGDRVLITVGDGIMLVRPR
jgi:predicted O-methyltransferase YrrM